MILKKTLGTLKDILHKKQESMEKILHLTHIQERAIEEEDSDKLLNIIEEKQNHIESIKELDKEFDSIYRENSEHINAANVLKNDREAYILYMDLKKLISDIQKCAEEIYALEEKNKDRLKRVMVDIKGKIKTVNDGRRGYNAYKQTPIQSDGVFVDRKK